MKTIAVYGAPGTGKLTVAKELSKITGYSVLHNHLINDLVVIACDFGDPEFFKIAQKYRLDIMEKAAQNKRKGVILTWVYAKKHDDKALSKIVRQAMKHNGDISFVRLACDKDELFKRVKDPSRKNFKKIKTIKKLTEVMNRQDLFSDVPHETNLVINNTKISAKQTAKIIKKHYKL